MRPHRTDLIDRYVDDARGNTFRQVFDELLQFPRCGSFGGPPQYRDGGLQPPRGFMLQHDFLKMINETMPQSGVV